MALARTKPFTRPTRKAPVYEHGVALFIMPGDQTQKIEIERAPDSGGSPGTWTSIALTGPFAKAGGYYVDPRPNDNATWWYRARHEAGDSYGSAGAYTTMAAGTIARDFSDTDFRALDQDGYPNPSAVIDIQTDGTATMTVDGPAWVKSYKYLGSLSAFPSVASVLATGSTSNGRQFTTSEVLEPGETTFTTLIPFSGENATGTQGESFRATGSFNTNALSQGSISILEDGSVNIAVDGATWVASYKYATSTSAFPSDATARAGTTSNGRQISISLGAATLDLGDTIYVTLLPYSTTGAAGYEGSSIRLRATRHDHSATKTIHFSTGALTLGDWVTNVAALHLKVNGGYITTAGTGPGIPANIYAYCDLQLPGGCTLTNVSADVYAESGDVTVAMGLILEEVSSTGGVTGLGSDGTPATGAGWETLSISLSDSTTGIRYRISLEFSIGEDSDIGKNRGASIIATYTMPSTVNSL